MSKANVQPLQNERAPANPIRPWVQPPDSYRYKVKSGDTWLTLATGYKHFQWFDASHLIWVNFGLSPTEAFYTEQVNWYLREYVGCWKSLDGGRNWAFNDADPGYIYLPNKAYRDDPHVITGKRGTGGIISAPQYDDQNFYDTLSKALDIFGMVDSGVGTLEIALPSLVEAGFIVAGALAGVIGPSVALGGGHNDALRKTSRDFFFTGFCRALVMRADGWLAGTIETMYPPLRYPPLNSVYPEKRESFRKLYNFGLKAGVLQGRRMNAVDIRNMFTFLRLRLTAAEREQYQKDSVTSWSFGKKKDYYGRLGSILAEEILKKNLRVKLS